MMKEFLISICSSGKSFIRVWIKSYGIGKMFLRGREILNFNMNTMRQKLTLPCLKRVILVQR